MSAIASNADSAAGGQGAAVAEPEVDGAERRPPVLLGESAFDAIYSEWFHEVSRWVRAFGGLDADLDDLVQEVFLVVRRKLGSFDGRNLPGWLYRITQRTVSDYRRRAWFRRYFQPRGRVLEEVIDPAPNPEHQAQRRDAERILVNLLGKLTPARRAAFILFEIEGYSGEEIAKLEGVPVKTVYTRLHYARKDFFRLVSELAASEATAASTQGAMK